MKPMLAPNDETILEDIKWPKLGSPKIDGVRGIIKDGQLVSRTLKPIPNLYIQGILGKKEYEMFDGELVVGDPFGDGLMQRTMSGVMSINKEPEDFTYYVFDYVKEGESYAGRYGTLIQLFEDISSDIPIKLLPCKLLNNLDEMLEYEKEWLEKGYEGIMLRDPHSLYKFGRATQRQNTLLKIKRFKDDEAVILGVTEGNKNNNPKTTNALGRGERSTHQEFMTPNGMLGNFQVRDLKTGIEFDVAPGVLKHDELKELWKDEGASLIGRVLTYKHFPIGVKDKPRFPNFKGWRPEMDFGEAK